MTRVTQHLRIVRRLFTVVTLVAATTSCGGTSSSSQSSDYLTVVSLMGAPGGTSKGNTAGTPSSTLLSSVQVLLTSPLPCSTTSPCPTVFDDIGLAALEVTPKNTLLSGPTAATTPNNQITLTRYHVAYSRADGQNTPGVGVPYAFDGTLTATLQPQATGSSGTIVQFELVRQVAKEEAPLVQLIESSSTVINTIATVTFYGSDQVGNAVSVSASMSIEFGYFPNQ
jgi:hypothetical protein